MAYHQLGQSDQAQKLLDEINRWMQEQQEKDPESAVPASSSWQDWAVYLILQREAAGSVLRPHRPN
jgi:hypothetical protein